MQEGCLINSSLDSHAILSSTFTRGSLHCSDIEGLYFDLRIAYAKLLSEILSLT